MNRTKIVCTIGPASSSHEILADLFDAGMNVARLNFSHGNREKHGRVIADLRTIAKKTGRPLAILQDLSGPKIRTGPLARGPVMLEPGNTFTLTARDVPGDAEFVSLTYKGLSADVREGDTLLLADGDLELLVEEAGDGEIRCRVVTGGLLGAHKGINLPGRSIRAPILNEKDKADMAFGVAEGVDYIALSFVRSVEDVESARRFQKDCGGAVPLIAKIEKHEAVNEMEGIIAAADGVMVARGDLGVEIPIERVPLVQKALIEEANRAGKPVITATQMLRSMVESPRPTRAEVTDVANAILDGTDAVMLSEETAIGRDPAGVVRTMRRIAVEAERIFPHDTWPFKFGDHPTLSVEEAVAHSACEIAEMVGASAIVTWTRSGSTTRLVSKYRPSRPILAITPDRSVYSRLALIWDVEPVCYEKKLSEAGMREESVRIALESGMVRPGGRVVITAGLPVHVPGTTNLVHVVTAG